MLEKMRLYPAFFSVLLSLLCSPCAHGSRPEALPSGPLTREEVHEEIKIKLGRVQTFIQEQHLAGILLTRINNFSWITAGAASNEIVITSDIGAASLLVMADGHKYVIGESGEVSRHVHEDLAGLGFEPVEYKWFEDQGPFDRKLEVIHRLAHGLQLYGLLPRHN
jgi:hypothetical protein